MRLCKSKYGFLSSLLLTVLLVGCGTTPTPISERKMIAFSMDGGSNGNFAGPAHYVQMDDETIWHIEEERIREYVSYLLSYGGIKEVSSEEDAEYILFVNYVSEAQSKEVQQFSLRAVSKRVYKALGELRASWVVASRHYGTSPAPQQMMPMHALSMRDSVGRNLNPYQKSTGFRVDMPMVLQLMESIEGLEGEVQELDSE